MGNEITINGNYWCVILTLIVYLTNSVQYIRGAIKYFKHGQFEILGIFKLLVLVSLTAGGIYWFWCIADKSMPMWFAFLNQLFLIFSIFRRVYHWDRDKQKMYWPGLSFRVGSIITMLILHDVWIVMMANVLTKEWGV